MNGGMHSDFARMLSRIQAHAETPAPTTPVAPPPVTDPLPENFHEDFAAIVEVRDKVQESDMRWGPRGAWKRWASPMNVNAQEGICKAFDFTQERHTILDETALVSMIGRPLYNRVWGSVIFPRDLQTVMQQEHGPNRTRWLSTAQRDAVMAILCGFNMCLVGIFGTGKSVVINVCVATLSKAYPTKHVCVNSTSASSANLIAGTTTHHAWAINYRRKNDYIRALNDTGLAEAVINFTDEISMLQPLSLYVMHERGCRVRRPKDMITALGMLAPFGGLQMVFTGDFGQLPPVQPKSDFALQSGPAANEHVGQAREEADRVEQIYSSLAISRLRPLVGRARYIFETPLFWSAFPWGIRLTQSMRQREPQFRALLENLRTGNITQHDAILLHLACGVEEDPGDCVRVMISNQEVDNINMERMRALGNPIVVSSMAVCHAATIDPERHSELVREKARLFAKAAREASAMNLPVQNTPTGRQIENILSRETNDQPWPTPLPPGQFGHLEMTPGGRVRLYKNIRKDRRTIYANGMNGILLGFLPIKTYSTPASPSGRKDDEDAPVRRRPKFVDADDSTEDDALPLKDKSTERACMPDIVAISMKGTWLTDIYGPNWQDLPLFRKLVTLSSTELVMTMLDDFSGVDVMFMDKYANTYGVHPLMAPAEWSRTEVMYKSKIGAGERGSKIKYDERVTSFLRYAVPVVRFDDPKFGVAVIPPMMHTATERDNAKVSCVQTPLRTSFASTVYGIQGCTVDKMVVDIKHASNPGEISVALSRVRTMGGLKILGTLPIYQIVADSASQFYETHCFKPRAT